MLPDDVMDFHENLAEQMVTEVQSWRGDPTSEQTQRLADMAESASHPGMLACFIAALAADARGQVLGDFADLLRTNKGP